MESDRKIVFVSAAAILRGGKVLACQRGYGDWKGCWEFPGGKKEKGETGEETVVREILEEIRIRVRPERRLCRVEYEYPSFHLSMEVFLCRPEEGKMALTEHQSARWIGPEALDGLTWCPADRTVLPALREALEQDLPDENAGRR